MSWQTFDWKPADGQSLGAGASVLPLWPMLRSAIAEGISADALCPITIGELQVGHCMYSEAPTSFVAAKSFELLGTDRRGSWAALDPEKGDKIGGNAYTADKLQGLVLEAMSVAFESILGEGLGLGPAIDITSPDAPMLLLRLPMTSLDTAFDDAVANELSAHIVALQALASEAATPAPAPVAPVSQRSTEFKTPAPAPMAPAAAAQ